MIVCVFYIRHTSLDQRLGASRKTTDSSGFRLFEVGSGMPTYQTLGKTNNFFVYNTYKKVLPDRLNMDYTAKN